jgi:hypothetical protein
VSDPLPYLVNLLRKTTSVCSIRLGRSVTATRRVQPGGDQPFLEQLRAGAKTHANLDRGYIVRLIALLRE